MQTGQVDFETIDQQIGVFGLQDSNIKQIEKTLSVQVSLRDSCCRCSYECAEKDL